MLTNIYYVLLNIVFIQADQPFNAKWSPLVDTAHYRIMVDGEQIGADWLAFFPTDVTWVLKDATPGTHTFEVLSINAAGQSTPVVVTINGATPPPTLKPPYSLKRILFVYRRDTLPDLQE